MTSILVWRRPTDDSGSSSASYDVDAVSRHISSLIATLSLPPEPFADEDTVPFWMDELFDKNILRQGWGTPGLDILREEFVIRYVEACFKYWGFDKEIKAAVKQQGKTYEEELDPFFRQGAGRQAILILMARAESDCPILVPKIDSKGNRDRVFTVVRSVSGYQWEDRSAQRGWRKDFGHYRDVTDIRCYPYSARTLTGSDFSRCRRAVTLIKPDHRDYAIFKRFLRKEGYL